MEKDRVKMARMREEGEVDRVRRRMWDREWRR